MLHGGREVGGIGALSAVRGGGATLGFDGRVDCVDNASAAAGEAEVVYDLDE
jgi:hypothetical protein